MFIYPKTGYQMSFCLDMYVRHDNHQIEGHGDNLKKDANCSNDSKPSPKYVKKTKNFKIHFIFRFLNISST